MILFEVGITENYLTYLYEGNEFFQWEKDTKECYEVGILLHSYKAYGRPLYYLVVDFSRMNKDAFKAMIAEEAKR